MQKLYIKQQGQINANIGMVIWEPHFKWLISERPAINENRNFFKLNTSLHFEPEWNLTVYGHFQNTMLWTASGFKLKILILRYLAEILYMGSFKINGFIML
jgi:hypothetical protein